MSTDNDGDRSRPERKRGFLPGELEHSSAEQRFADVDKSDSSDAEIIQLMSDSSDNSIGNERSSTSQYLYKDEYETPTGNTKQNISVKLRRMSLEKQESSGCDENSTCDEGTHEDMPRKMARAQGPTSSDEPHGATGNGSRKAPMPLSAPAVDSVKYNDNTTTSKSKKHRAKTRNRIETSKQNGRSARYVHEEKNTTKRALKGKRMQRKKNETEKEKRKPVNVTEQELRSQARKLVASPRLFRAFQQKMGEWITQNYGRMIDIFRRFDADQSGTISYDEFFYGMNALGAPTTKAEMYIMATTLDADNDNAIDYKEFAKLRRQYRAASGSFQKTADLPSAESPSMTQVQLLQPCSRCEVGIWEPVDEDMPRFVCLNLRWSSSQDNESYPQSFCATVQSATSIYGVSRIVKKELGHCVMNITIYRPLVGGESELLSPEKKLSDYGFCGTTPPEPPEEVSLIYDYEYPFLDCPLLMADLQLTRRDKYRDEDTSNVTQVTQAERKSDTPQS